MESKIERGRPANPLSRVKTHCFVLKVSAGVLAALIALSVIYGCSNDEAPAAPLSDTNALESLARAFEDVSQSIPISPGLQTPQQKKSFVTDVFARAGFSYRATLFVVAQSDLHDENVQSLVELLLFPALGVGSSEIASIYSADELEAVRKLQVR